EALVLPAQLRTDEHPAPVASDGEVVVVPAGETLADVALHLLALGRVLQPREQRRLAPLVRPGRDDADEVVVAPRVSGYVGMDGDTATAGVLDQGDDLPHPAPEPLVGDLDVDDVDRDPGALPDRDRPLHRVEHLGPLVADVRRVEPPALLDDAAELDEVV